jgi:hypothetical protein
VRDEETDGTDQPKLSAHEQALAPDFRGEQTKRKVAQAVETGWTWEPEQSGENRFQSENSHWSQTKTLQKKFWEALLKNDEQERPNH